MKTFFLNQPEIYDGKQLASLFAYRRFGILGDSVVSWIGPCDVTQHMVDVEDQRAGAEIRGGHMLHFIVEIFGQTLAVGVCVQRILASLIADQMRSRLAACQFHIQRSGDDLYVSEINNQNLVDARKWSISIATQSPVSTLVHFAVNVTNEATPVPTWSFLDLIQREHSHLNTQEAGARATAAAQTFAEDIMNGFTSEYLSVIEATQKVHPVSSYSPVKTL